MKYFCCCCWGWQCPSWLLHPIPQPCPVSLLLQGTKKSPLEEFPGFSSARRTEWIGKLLRLPRDTNPQLFMGFGIGAGSRQLCSHTPAPPRDFGNVPGIQAGSCTSHTSRAPCSARDVPHLARGTTENLAGSSLVSHPLVFHPLKVFPLKFSS